MNELTRVHSVILCLIALQSSFRAVIFFVGKQALTSVFASDDTTFVFMIINTFPTMVLFSMLTLMVLYW